MVSSASALVEHRADETFYWLEQIAAALGMPVSAFLKPVHEPSGVAAVIKGEEELLRLFREIRDPGTRERLLGFVQAAADGSGAGEGS
ncbi:hypothetical protein ASG32_30580 [Methylobacterium sp. Leaf361]|uniref:hypothetical protein n=1 Tax=Methylobacterium sp. Leaf361 TaxID=1736352 RepID=UPI0006F8901D|nr:hypothetical protein [Methylobacterium sp. Leaf361]KQS67546.1 hypothetical protein ASG32_30580 [Methylobacterium sp. Leaf361]